MPEDKNSSSDGQMGTFHDSCLLFSAEKTKREPIS
jgi:hypothetical protein